MARAAGLDGFEGGAGGVADFVLDRLVAVEGVVAGARNVGSTRWTSGMPLRGSGAATVPGSAFRNELPFGLVET